MSGTFQVTKTDGTRVTVNAATVSMVVSQNNGDQASISFGSVSVDVRETYRSVRGYLNKALASKPEPLEDK